MIDIMYWEEFSVQIKTDWPIRRQKKCCIDNRITSNSMASEACTTNTESARNSVPQHNQDKPNEPQNAQKPTDDPKHDPSNYRMITVNSTIAKLLSMTLCNRLGHFLKNIK